MTLLTVILLLIGVETDYVKNPPPGDNGKAIGVLQIHPIMVRQVNQVGSGVFTLNDRFDRTKSIQMASMFLSHQMVRFRVKHGRRPSARELMCSWNTGSIFKEAPKRYQERVDRYLGPSDAVTQTDNTLARN